MRKWIAIMVTAALALAWMSPSTARAADGFDPACDAPEDWPEQFNVVNLMHNGYPDWFEACHPDMPPMWPTDVEPPLAPAAGTDSEAPAGLDTSSPGTLWDQPVADPLTGIQSTGNNILNFNGFGDTSNFRIADDFFLSPELLDDPDCRIEITEVRYSELQTTGEAPPIDAFLLEIWDHDAAGRPDGLVPAMGPFAADSAAFVGIEDFQNFEVYEMTWNFGAPLVLDPGTYWLSASEDNNGTTSGDTTTGQYQVASGSFGPSQCNACTGLWTVNGSNTFSLDFDIDGEVVCPQAPPAPQAVGGFGIGEVESAVPSAVAPVGRGPLAGIAIALAVAVAGAAVWRRRR